MPGQNKVSRGWNTDVQGRLCTSHRQDKAGLPAANTMLLSPVGLLHIGLPLAPCPSRAALPCQRPSVQPVRLSLGALLGLAHTSRLPGTFRGTIGSQSRQGGFEALLCSRLSQVGSELFPACSAFPASVLTVHMAWKTSLQNDTFG